MAFIINVGDSSVCASVFGIGHALANRIETTRFGYKVI
jgi:hypothetical protein